MLIFLVVNLMCGCHMQSLWLHDYDYEGARPSFHAHESMKKLREDTWTTRVQGQRNSKLLQPGITKPHPTLFPKLLEEIHGNMVGPTIDAWIEVSEACAMYDHVMLCVCLDNGEQARHT